jgi:2-amino-4-hydroxy-6-hydroxymethyldihydropteridine diphosphokinase
MLTILENQAIRWRILELSIHEHISIGIHHVYLALGSNIGNRQKNLSSALKRLCEIVDIHKISSVYETDPVGYLIQPHFLNMVCYGQTALSPEELLRGIKTIEEALGRQPSFRNAPRPIDIDILLYGDLHFETEHLTIPHPRMSERAFVLAPLVEIAPTAIEPVSGKTAQELLLAISQIGISKLDGCLDT